MMKWGLRKSTRAWVERWAPHAGFEIKDHQALNAGIYGAVAGAEGMAELATNTGGVFRPESGQATGINALSCALGVNPEAIQVINQDRFSAWLVTLVMEKNVSPWLCAQLAYVACPEEDYQMLADALRLDPESLQSMVVNLKPFGRGA